MQKQKITQFIIIVFIISMNALSISQNRDIFTMFPTLNSQISENLENISERAEITARLKSYIDMNNPEMVSFNQAPCFVFTLPLPADSSYQLFCRCCINFNSCFIRVN